MICVANKSIRSEKSGEILELGSLDVEIARVSAVVRVEGLEVGDLLSRGVPPLPPQRG